MKITEADRGLTFPYVRQRDVPYVSREPWHLQCFRDALDLIE